MGFDAASIEKLDYDFTAFGGGKGGIPEPRTDQVTEFWAEWVGMLRGAQARAKDLDKDAPKDETPEQADERIRSQIVAGQHRSTETIAMRRKLLAQLCSSQPSEEELEKLPHRVLNAFEAYMMGVLSPEGSSTATT